MPVLEANVVLGNAVMNMAVLMQAKNMAYGKAVEQFPAMVIFLSKKKIILVPLK